MRNLLLLASMSLLCSPHVNAADISWQPGDDNDIGTIHIEGELVEQDLSAFETVIERVDALRPTFIMTYKTHARKDKPQVVEFFAEIASLPTLALDSKEAMLRPV